MNQYHRRKMLGGALALVVMPARAGGTGVNFSVPAGSCDCHHHIYDPRYPYAPGAMLKPPPAIRVDYQALQTRLGITRSVVVQPSSYGTDNRCLLDFMARARRMTRGVCVVNSLVSDDELRSLHAAGVRGIRIRLGLGNPVTPDEIVPLAKRVVQMGWHMQFNMPPEQLVQMESQLMRLPLPVVIDHLGHATDIVSPQYRTLRKLLDSGRGWIKLSGVYLYGKGPAPDYSDSSEAAKSYIAAAPERCVWGSDWPHTDATSGRVPMPDDAGLLNLLAAWAPNAKLRHRILVENPEILYGFDPAKRL
jgi:predicted TIM-barrel fold metal-dependent hydrolase